MALKSSVSVSRRCLKTFRVERIIHIVSLSAVVKEFSNAYKAGKFVEIRVNLSTKSARIQNSACRNEPQMNNGKYIRGKYMRGITRSRDLLVSRILFTGNFSIHVYRRHSLGENQI